MLVDSIVDENRRVDQQAHFRFIPYRATDEREALQEVDVVQERFPEPFGCFGMLRPRVGEDLFEVDQRGF